MAKQPGKQVPAKKIVPPVTGHLKQKKIRASSTIAAFLLIWKSILRKISLFILFL